MSQAARNIHTSSVVARKRTVKPLRGVRQHTGNLNVYSQANREHGLRTSKTIPRIAASDAALYPAAQKTAAAKSSLPHHSQAANHDSAGKLTHKTDFRQRLATVPTPYYLLMGVVAVGALSTALYISSNGESGVQLTQSAAQSAAQVEAQSAAQAEAQLEAQSEAQSAAQLEAQSEAQSAAQPADPAVSGQEPSENGQINSTVANGNSASDAGNSTSGSSASTIDATDLQETTADTAVSNYQLEIDRLNDENRLLQARLNQVSTEALDLNQELLDLELVMVQTESEAQANTETRIVYNFVDVPLGQNVSSVPVRSVQNSTATEQFSGSEGFVGEEELEETPQYIETEELIEPEQYAEPEQYQNDLEDPDYVDEYANEMGMIFDEEEGLQSDPNFSDEPSTTEYDANGNPLIDEDSAFERSSPGIQYPPVPDGS